MGFGKYGRAEDSGGVIVRHIPIIIEGHDNEDEIATDKDDRNETQLYSNSIPVNMVKVPIVSVRANNDRKFGGQRYDRSSTSSTESENSVDISNSKRRSDDLTRKWQRLKGSSNSDTCNSDNNNINNSNFSNRTPLNEVTQKRHTLASARKSSNPKYVVIKETVGSDHCPVHGTGHHHHHHHHHREQDDRDSHREHCDKIGGFDRETEVYSEQLRAPQLIRKTNLTHDDECQFEKKKPQSTLQKGRPKHSNPSLAPIKENVSVEKMSRDKNSETFSFNRTPRRGSFRESRNFQLESSDQDRHKRGSNQPLQRRWSMRLPTSSNKHLGMPSGAKSNDFLFNNKNSDYHKSDFVDNKEEIDNQKVIISTRSDVTRVSPLELKHAQSSSQGKVWSANEAEKVNNCEIAPKETPCVGILKTPGKRKTSNNRVEFLDNLQEREIPSRHT